MDDGYQEGSGMKLAKLIVGMAAAAVLGTSSAVAAPKQAPVERSASPAAINALRQVPTKPSRVATPPKEARAVVTPVSRGAVWLPKIRSKSAKLR